MEYALMIVSANGIHYFVKIHQKDELKPNVILLHGFMGSGQGFAPLMDHLYAFCNPVTIDLLGHGKTEGAASAERFSVGRQIDDLKAIISQIAPQKTFLHGYSMGGRLALRYALQYPETLAGLILESTHYGLEGERKINQRKKINDERAQAIEQDFPAFLKEWETLPIFQNGISLPEEKLHHYKNIQEQQNPEQMANSLLGFGAAQMSSVKNELKTLKMPVLLLAGQADLKYAEIAQTMHKKLPRSTLQIAPNAGHRVHVEHPKALVEALQSFLTKN